MCQRCGAECKNKKGSAEMRKSMKKSETAITTIIGKDSVVEGDFRSSGSVRLDGTIE